MRTLIFSATLLGMALSGSGNTGERMGSDARAPTLSGAPPLVIAHRGASGYRPEHTLEAYRLAIEMGADFIEPDLVSTRDGQLVARHEPNITATTDVAARPEFADRRRVRLIDGIEETGWFAADFTLAELRTLRAVQPRPGRSREFDGHFGIPTLNEIIDLARTEGARRGRAVGIYPETKHPTWHCEQGLPLEPALLRSLREAGWTQRSAPVFIQSFESGNLQWLRSRTSVRLVQLLDSTGQTDAGNVLPARAWQPQAHCTLYSKGRLPQDFSTAESFREISRYADAVGPWKRMLIPSRLNRVGAAAGNESGADGAARPAIDPAAEPNRSTLPPTDFVKLAHAAGLAVHPWTFRNEPQYLASNYARDPKREYAAFFALGIDALFSDFPDTAVAAR